MSDWKEGDRVVSETAAYICGVCEFCLSGEYNLCPKRLGFGYGVDGAFAQYVKVPVRCLHKIPADMSFEVAALTEPLAVSYNAVCVKSHILPGQIVAVLGPGPTGLFSAYIAKISGARVIVAGLNVDEKVRLQTARNIGVDVVINSEKEDISEIVDDLTHGSGVPLVVDAAGTPSTLEQSMRIVKRNGQITRIGWGAKPVDFSLAPIVEKAVRLQGVFSHTWPTWENCLNLMKAGVVNLEVMISAKLPITDWQKAYSLVEKREVVKVILSPSS